MVITVTTLADAKARFSEIVASAEGLTNARRSRGTAVQLSSSSLRRTLRVSRRHSRYRIRNSSVGFGAGPASRQSRYIKTTCLPVSPLGRHELRDHLDGRGHRVTWIGYHSRSRLRSWRSSTVLSLRTRTESASPCGSRSPAGKRSARRGNYRVIYEILGTGVRGRGHRGPAPRRCLLRPGVGRRTRSDPNHRSDSAAPRRRRFKATHAKLPRLPPCQVAMR